MMMTFEQILLPISRWLHIMASTLLVGGTLFFEFVVPRALVDVRREQQLSLIAYLRLVFRWIVWGCVIVLPITGCVSVWNLWRGYVSTDGHWTPGFAWAIAHVAISFIAMGIAAALVIGRSVPERSRQWMKLNFVILMVVILLASSARQVRLYTRQRMVLQQGPTGSVLPYTTP